MSTTAIRDQLRAISFLDGLTDSAYHQLARLVSLVRYETDEILFEEGAPRTFLALVVSGTVAIEKQMNGRPIRLVTLGPGEAVGEGLLLDDSKHGTSARALQPTDVYALRVEKVQDMLREHPQLYAALIGRAARAISQRLAATDATIVG
ncbi:MAG TPA: cyclic nucleotide-binding domain-containing protein, partial [Gemmatimonadaceae bacterium]|nr:cyclic nucleotide-binding domain-containing protein [Gemmatimonadaceae bacterium]